MGAIYNPMFWMILGAGLLPILICIPSIIKLCKRQEEAYNDERAIRKELLKKLRIENEESNH